MGRKNYRRGKEYRAGAPDGFGYSWFCDLYRGWAGRLKPLQSPYVLIGTVGKLIEELHSRRERWGISYYVIFEPYVDAFAPVVARLAGD